MRKGGISRLKKFLQEDDGQAIVEYVLLLSVVLVGAASLARAILRAIDSGVLRLGGQLEKDLKSGRTRLNDWRN